MKKITYAEPKDYFPKNIRDQYFGKKASTTKKAAPAKKAAPKKK